MFAAVAIERLYTYKEAAVTLEVHPKTVARWFADYRQRLFHPTRATSRIPESLLRAFIAENTGKLAERQKR